MFKFKRFAKGVEYVHGFRDDFGADTVTGQDCDFLCHVLLQIKFTTEDTEHTEKDKSLCVLRALRG